jgi:glycerophosphoryl diester phosphodiesterase
MKVSKRTTIIILALTALFFAFTLLHASWLAEAPKGTPKLVADRGVAPVLGSDGCMSAANSGYGAVAVGPDLAALQLAAGAEADAVHIPLEAAGDALVPVRQFESKCAADLAQRRPDIAATAYSLSRPELFWQVQGADAAKALLAKLPAGDRRHMLIGDEAAVAVAKAERPAMRAFTLAAARKCAADYRGSYLGSVPESCAGGVMLLTLDELGFTLWGWPNRFLQRMAEAKTMVIIAQDVEGEKIKGLTNVKQYGDIAQGYNGYIWVDKIEELGPALRR